MTGSNAHHTITVYCRTSEEKQEIIQRAVAAGFVRRSGQPNTSAFIRNALDLQEAGGAGLDELKRRVERVEHELASLRVWRGA